MKILIDLQSCQTASAERGIGRYSLAHARGIAKNSGPHEVEILLNGFNKEREDKIRLAFQDLIRPNAVHVFGAPGPVFELDPRNAARCRVAERVRTHFIRGLKPDIIHVTSHFEGVGDNSPITIEGDLPYSVTLYDCIPYLRPDVYLPSDQLKRLYYRKVDEFRRAKLWLAISESARLEGIGAYNLPQDHVKTISTAADERFQPLRLTSDIQKSLMTKHGLSRPFIMYTATFEPRKNIQKLLHAFSLIDRRIRKDYQLLLVCQANEEIRYSLFKEAKELGLGGDELILANFLSDDDLVVLYNIATLFVFPSLHEGFGLPALEAMQCGTATIGSNTSSVPEIIGRKDALFNPTDANEISSVITRVLIDDDYRHELERSGVIRARSFSWQNTADLSISAFEQLYDELKPRSSQTCKSDNYKRLVSEIRDIAETLPDAQLLDLTQTANSISLNLDHLDSLRLFSETSPTLIWKVEGPLDSTYSLALLNRETARALMRKNYDVILHNTEGPGDYPPNLTFLLDHNDILDTLQTSQLRGNEVGNVVSRNLYPPRVTDMRADVAALHHFAWEESGLPGSWVDMFNLHLQKITSLSNHVKKILIDNGVSVDNVTSGCGVDHWCRVEPDENFSTPGKGFRFLHVSSCFPRKGVDVLLSAYGQRFRDSDDVTLIIKTFDNPHNTLHEQLRSLRESDPDYPNVEVIWGDIDDNELRALYEICDVLVSPSRAEGFGLPMAEALVSGIPVIATNWGGHLDFCSTDCAWLVDYDFAYSQTHFNLAASVWAEPRQDSLADAMMAAFNSSKIERETRARIGSTRLLNNFTWDRVTQRLVDHCRTSTLEVKKPKISWVTTWNTKCGIAAYSQHLVDNMPLGAVSVFAQCSAELIACDEQFVTRCWPSTTEHEDGLVEIASAIGKSESDVVVIQFNYGFYNFDALKSFIRKQVHGGRLVIVDLHATIDPVGHPSLQLGRLIEEFALCARILVHGVPDLNRLKSLGLVENVTLCPLGMLDWPEPDLFPLDASKPIVISTYGFCLPHKGLIETVEACALLRDRGYNIQLSMLNAEYPADVSRDFAVKIRKKITELGLSNVVSFITDYLSDDESLLLLGEAHVIIFPYQITAESASAAVRVGLASGRPVVTTSLPIFDDLRGSVSRISGFSSSEIADGLTKIIISLGRDDMPSSDWMLAAKSWRSQHRYSSISARIQGMIDGLRRSRGSNL